MSNDVETLRQQLVALMRGGNAHADFEQAIADVPAELRGKRVAGQPHSLWELLEHMRIAQWDILEFSRNPKHVSPKWPSGYWPKTQEPPSPDAWDDSVRSLRDDLAEMIALVSDPKTNLFTKIPGGEDQTILREAMLVADHNAYHLGQFVLARRLLSNWR